MHLTVQQLYGDNYWVHCTNEHTIVIQDDQEDVLKQEKINVVKNEEFVEFINSVVIGAGKTEDYEDKDHMSNYC